MKAQQDLELTIRTATLIKSLSSLIGARDPFMARMMLSEASDQFIALGKFIESIQPAKRTG